MLKTTGHAGEPDLCQLQDKLLKTNALFTSRSTTAEQVKLGDSKSRTQCDWTLAAKFL